MTWISLDSSTSAARVTWGRHLQASVSRMGAQPDSVLNPSSKSSQSTPSLPPGHASGSPTCNPSWTCVHLCVQTCYVCTCVCADMLTCAPVCVQTCLCQHLCMCRHAWVCACMCAQACLCVHPCVQACGGDRHACVCTCVYAGMLVCAPVCAGMLVCAPVYANMLACVQASLCVRLCVCTHTWARPACTL
jgi:hypothetical protein